MDIKHLVQMAEHTHKACGWSGGAQFELDPETAAPGSLVAYFEVHKTKLDGGNDQLAILQEIKEKVYTIWGSLQKGIEFWRWDECDSGLLLVVWLDRGTPD